MFNQRVFSDTIKTLIACACVFLLYVIVVPQGCGCGSSKAAKLTATHFQLTDFKNLLQTFMADCGRYPTEKEGLAALIDAPGLPGWKGPYLAGDIPPDPWGNEYRYRLSNGFPQMRSSGPDGSFGTPDDLAADINP